MKKIFFTILIIAFFLDYSFLPMLSLEIELGANFLLLVVVAAFLKRSFFESAGWALLGGLLLDYVSSFPLGLSFLSFLFLGFFIDIFQKKFLATKPSIISLLLIFSASFVFFEGVRITLAEIFSFMGIISGTPDFKIQDIFSTLVLKAILVFAGVFLMNLIQKIEWLMVEKPTEIKVDGTRL